MQIDSKAFELLRDWQKDSAIRHPFNSFWHLSQRDYEKIKFYATKKYATAVSKEWFKDRLGTYEEAQNYRRGDTYLIVEDLKENCCFGRRHSYGIKQGLREEIYFEISRAFNYVGNGQYDIGLRYFRDLYEKFDAWHMKFRVLETHRKEFEELSREVSEIDVKKVENFFQETFNKGEEN